MSSQNRLQLSFDGRRMGVRIIFNAEGVYARNGEHRIAGPAPGGPDSRVPILDPFSWSSPFFYGCRLFLPKRKKAFVAGSRHIHLFLSIVNHYPTRWGAARV